MSKLPQLSQDYFNENRERFDAETTEAPVRIDKHIHDFIRKTGSEIGCKSCTAGWLDPSGKLRLELSDR